MPTIADYVATIKLDTASAEKSLKEFDKDTKKGSKKAEKRFSKLGDKLGDSVKSGTSKIALAVGGLSVGGLLKVAADIEAGFIGVQKTTGLTNDEINRLKRNLLDFSQEAPVTVTSLIEIAKVAGQLGIQGAANIEKFTQTFAKLEVASDRTVAGEFGAQEFAKFVEQSGAGIENAERVASAMTLLGNTSKLTEGQLLSVAAEVGKLSKAFNISTASTLGISAAFQEMSITPEVARTTILKFFTAVERADKTGEGMAALASATGLTAERIRELQATNPEKLLVAFGENINNVDAKTLEQNLKDLKLTGSTIGPVLKALASSGGKLAEKIDASNSAYRENIALTKEFDSANHGTNAEITKLKNSISALADSAASSGLLDWITQVISKLGGVVQAVGEAIDHWDTFKKEFNDSGSIFDSGAALGEKLFGRKGEKTKLGEKVFGKDDPDVVVNDRKITSLFDLGRFLGGDKTVGEVQSKPADGAIISSEKVTVKESENSSVVTEKSNVQSDRLTIKQSSDKSTVRESTDKLVEKETVDSRFEVNTNEVLIKEGGSQVIKRENVSHSDSTRERVETNTENNSDVLLERNNSERIVESKEKEVSLSTEKVLIKEGAKQITEKTIVESDHALVEKTTENNQSKVLESATNNVLRENNNESRVERNISDHITETHTTKEIAEKTSESIASFENNNLEKITRIEAKTVFVKDESTTAPFIPNPESGNIVFRIGEIIGEALFNGKKANAPQSTQKPSPQVVKTIQIAANSSVSTPKPQPINNYNKTTNNRNQDVTVNVNNTINGSPDQRAVGRLSQSVEQSARKGVSLPFASADTQIAR